MRCECENLFALPALLNGPFLGGDDRGFLKDEVKTYPIAPMSILNSLTCFSVFTSVVYGLLWCQKYMLLPRSPCWTWCRSRRGSSRGQRPRRSSCRTACRRSRWPARTPTECGQPGRLRSGQPSSGWGATPRTKATLLPVRRLLLLLGFVLVEPRLSRTHVLMMGRQDLRRCFLRTRVVLGWRGKTKRQKDRINNWLEKKRRSSTYTYRDHKHRVLTWAKAKERVGHFGDTVKASNSSWKLWTSRILTSWKLWTSFRRTCYHQNASSRKMKRTKVVEKTSSYFETLFCLFFVHTHRKRLRILQV